MHTDAHLPDLVITAPGLPTKASQARAEAGSDRTASVTSTRVHSRDLACLHAGEQDPHLEEADKLSPNQSMASFCVVLPVYNERHVIEPCLRTLYCFLETVPCRTAIVAVDDGSQDGTAELLDRLVQEMPGLIVRRHASNSGYGAANRTGLQTAADEQFDYALVMDADGTQDPVFIERFFEPMSRGIDLIKATRYSAKSRVEGVSFKRRFISWAGNMLAKAVLRLPVSDYTNGFRAVRTSLISRPRTTESGFAVLIEEVALAKQVGATFAEVPYTLTARQDRRSASKFIYSAGIYRRYLTCLFKR